MVLHRAFICVFAVLLALNAAIAYGAFILTDIPLGQSFTYQIPCVERPSTTNDTEFFRLPITTRYANIKYRASWQDPIVVFFVLISREYPRLGSFDYSLERVFNNTEISVTVPGEEGKTTNYFSHQVFLGPRPSHTVTFTISVEPLTGTNVPVVSSAPGNFYVVNVTAPQRNFPLAELTTASKFQDMFVLRASPSYSVDDFKIRTTIQDSHTQEPVTGVGQKLFVTSDDTRVGTQATYILASVPAVPLEFLPNVTYTLNATFFRPMTAYFRTPKEVGKTSSYRAIFRVTSTDDRTFRFRVEVRAGKRRWPLTAYDDVNDIESSSAQADGRTEIIDLSPCLQDSANNATYFTIMALTQDANSYTYDELVAGALNMTFEITIEFLLQAPAPLAPGQLIASDTPLALALTEYPDALATNKVLKFTPVNSGAYTVGSVSVIDPYDSSCYPLGFLEPKTFLGPLDKFACAVFFPEQVVGLTPRNFSYAINEPQFLNSTISSFNITIANPFLERNEGHHALGADVPLPAVISMVPRRMSGNTEIRLTFLRGRPCAELTAARYFGSPPALTPILTSAICRDTAFSFVFSGSTAFDLQVTGMANMTEVIVTTSTTFQITVPAGNVTILKLTVPVPAPGSRSFIVSVDQVALYFVGNCATGLSQQQNSLSLVSEGFVSISGDASSETLATVTITEKPEGCSTEWPIPSLCASRILSRSSTILDEAALQSTRSFVEGANSIFNNFFPGQNTTACYNAFMDMSCDTFVPFCVNNVVRSPQTQYVDQCRSKLATGGCTAAQVDRLCLQYPGSPQLLTLDQMLAGPPMLPPVNEPLNPPVNIPMAAPSNSQAPTTDGAIPTTAPSLTTTTQPVAAPSVQIVSTSSQIVQSSIAFLFVIVFASFLAF